MSKTFKGSIQCNFKVVFTAEEVAQAEAQLNKEYPAAVAKKEAGHKLTPQEHALINTGGDIEKLFQTALRSGIREGLAESDIKTGMIPKGSIKVTFDAPRN